MTAGPCALGEPLLDRVTAIVRSRVGAGGAGDAFALRFLLPRTAAEAEPSLRRACDAWLARAADGEHPDQAPAEALMLAAAVGVDQPTAEMAWSFHQALHRDWRDDGDLVDAMAAIDAALTGATRFGWRETIAVWVDRLEGRLLAAYEPGAGLSNEPSPSGTLAAHVRAATTLLVAFDVTGRLPYPMLAEELVQHVRRTLLDPTNGLCWSDPEGQPRRQPFALNCEVARLFGRLAVLHRDAGYRQAATVVAEASYDEDARRALGTLCAQLPDSAADAARFGLALDEWVAR